MVSDSEIQQLVEESGALLHKEVSAKKNQGVNEVL